MFINNRYVMHAVVTDSHRLCIHQEVSGSPLPEDRSRIALNRSAPYKKTSNLISDTTILLPLLRVCSWLPHCICSKIPPFPFSISKRSIFILLPIQSRLTFPVPCIFDLHFQIQYQDPVPVVLTIYSDSSHIIIYTLYSPNIILCQMQFPCINNSKY